MCEHWHAIAGKGNGVRAPGRCNCGTRQAIRAATASDDGDVCSERGEHRDRSWWAQVGIGLMARCPPLGDDSEPNVSIRNVDDDKVLVHSHVGWRSKDGPGYKRARS